jgi:hypothetical protein
MRNEPEWDDRTRLDLNPADEPLSPAAPTVQRATEEEVVDTYARRVRVVRTVNTIINLLCGLFAVVLALHIVLVLANANPSNGFASFVDSFSSAVSLGLRGLFTPASVKLQVLLNDGLAAIVWLLIGAALTYAIRQFALPGPRRSIRHYRRGVVQ